MSARWRCLSHASTSILDFNNKECFDIFDLFANFGTGHNIDVCAALPYLGCLLTVPSPREHIFTRLYVFRNDHLVGNHAKSPVSTAPALVTIVIRGIKLCRHVGRVTTIPTLVDLWTGGQEVGAICLIWAKWGSLLCTGDSRGTLLSPAATNKRHPYVVCVDSRNWVASPG